MADLRQRRRSFVADSAAHIRESIEEFKTKLTLTWHEIPDWMKDNEYIHSGYRRVQNSWSGAFHSLFAYIHNESVNVHSHLWPAFLFLFFLGTMYSTLSQYNTTTWLDGSYLAIFLSAATICLACSAFFHLSLCHSQQITYWTGCIDYFGIIVLIVGSFYPSVYYGFYCESWWQRVYLSGITIAGIGASMVVIMPTFSQPKYRPFRATVFVALGMFGVFPVGHALVKKGVGRLLDEMGFFWLLLSAGLYLSGAFIYANRFPEKWWPGKFDYFLASHQIFHIHVVFGALAHYGCVMTAFHHWHGVRGGTCMITQ